MNYYLESCIELLYLANYDPELFIQRTIFISIDSKRFRVKIGKWIFPSVRNGENIINKERDIIVGFRETATCQRGIAVSQCATESLS